MKSSRSFAGAGLCLAAVLAGCGGQAGQSGSTGTDSAGLSGNPVNVHLITSVGVSLFDNPQFVDAVNAAAESINGAGGVGADHRPLQITFCNDKSDPNEGLACGRKAVDDGADAVLGVSITGASFLPVLEKADIAYINWPTTGADFESSASFPIVGGDATQDAGIPVLAKQAGAKSVAIGISECGPCDPKLQQMVDTANQIGLEVKGTVRWPYTTADFTPTLQKVKDLGAEAFLFAAGTVDGAGIAKAADRSGLTASIVTDASHLSLIQTSQTGGAALRPEFNGALAVFQLPPTTHDIPAITQFKQEIAAYVQRTRKSVPLGQSTEGGWFMAHGLAAVIGDISGDITSASVTEALRKAQNVDVLGALTWSPGAVGPAAFPRVTNWSVWFGKVDKGELVLDSATPVDLRQSAGIR